jgi:16S rRNA (guanine527-N7)-methyltransferase
VTTRDPGRPNSESVQGPAAFERQFGVSRETLDRLVRFVALVGRWQARVNLVSPASLGAIWQRHMADSAQLLRLAPPGPLRWVDLGTGGGFPGLVVAVMLAERPGSRVFLVESDLKKAAFLREAVRDCGLGGLGLVDIVAGRVENQANQAIVGPVQVVSARALAPLPRLLGWAFPYFSADTVGLFPKGRGVADELAEAKEMFSFAVDEVASLTDPEARVLVIRGLARRD